MGLMKRIEENPKSQKMEMFTVAECDECGEEDFYEYYNLNGLILCKECLIKECKKVIE